MWSDMVAMVITAVEAAFEWQAVIWEEYDVLVTFMLVFVAAVFFRLIVVRMFGGGDSMGIGSDIAEARASSETYVNSRSKGYSGGRWLKGSSVKNPKR